MYWNDGTILHKKYNCEKRYLPKFSKYLRNDIKDYPRGSYQFAPNIEHNISMHFYHDKNPLCILLTYMTEQILMLLKDNLEEIKLL